MDKRLVLEMALRNKTKTCYRFESKDAAGNFITLYLKQVDVDAAGINPEKGITVTVEEAPTDAKA